MATDLIPASIVPAAQLWVLLGSVIYPLWLAAGIADILLHRRDRIELHAGSRESAMHVVQSLQMGVPVLLVLFLDFTAPVFLFCLALVVVHAWTSWADTRFADRVRHIGPAEQKVHVVLDAVPWFALALVALANAPALVGLVSTDAADWGLRARTPAFPAAVIAAVLASSLAFGLLPPLLEYARARRTVRSL